MPIHQHDCDKCKFIRSTILDSETNAPVDIYHSCQGSLLVRFGDDGPDYESMPLAMVHPRSDSLLGKAARHLEILGILRVQYTWR